MFKKLRQLFWKLVGFDPMEEAIAPPTGKVLTPEELMKIGREYRENLARRQEARRKMTVGFPFSLDLMFTEEEAVALEQLVERYLVWYCIPKEVLIEVIDGEQRAADLYNKIVLESCQHPSRGHGLRRELLEKLQAMTKESSFRLDLRLYGFLEEEIDKLEALAWEFYYWFNIPRERVIEALGDNHWSRDLSETIAYTKGEMGKRGQQMVEAAYVSAN